MGWHRIPYWMVATALIGGACGATPAPAEPAPLPEESRTAVAPALAPTDESHFTEISAHTFGGRNQSAIDAALAFAGRSRPTILLLSAGRWNLAADADWSRHGNVIFRLLPGAVLDHGRHALKIPNRVAPPAPWLAGTGPVIFTGHVGSIRPEEFGAGTDRTPAQNSHAFARLIRVARHDPADGGTGRAHPVFIPAGTYELADNFPVRHSEEEGPLTALKDYHGLRIFGVGPESVIKTRPPGRQGADVFQLNGVKNVTIEHLAVAAEISPDAIEGSNGFSITGGGANITVRSCAVRRLPFVDNGVGTNGGQAFCVQQAGTGSLGYSAITVSGNSAAGGSYGVNLQASGAGTLAAPWQGVLVEDNVLRNFFRGINVETSATGEPSPSPRLVGRMQATIVGNLVLDCQQSFLLQGVTGVTMTDNVASSRVTQSLVKFDARIQPVTILSTSHSEFSRNRVAQSSTASFVCLGGGFEGLPDTPADHVDLIDNLFVGQCSGFGIQTTPNAGYGHAVACHLIGNVFDGTVAEEFNPAIDQVGAGNVLVSEKRLPPTGGGRATASRLSGILPP